MDGWMDGSRAPPPSRAATNDSRGKEKNTDNRRGTQRGGQQRVVLVGERVVIVGKSRASFKWSWRRRKRCFYVMDKPISAKSRRKKVDESRGAAVECDL